MKIASSQSAWLGVQKSTMRHGVAFLLVGLIFFAGCGSGDDSNQCTSRGDASGPGPCASAARTCYVSPNGSDANDGSAADALHAFRTIDRALEVVQSNYTVVVAPGTYRGGINTDREGQCAPEGLALIADSSRNAVVIDATGAAGLAGIRLSNGDDSIVDGFTIINSPGSGILIKSQSDRLQIRNNIIRGNGSDGIRVQDSSDVLVFNNLVYSNDGIGIALVGAEGSPRGRVISNTATLNAGRGLEIGRSNGASPGAYVRNNIFQENGGAESLKVFDNSLAGYSGNFNLVFPATYLPRAVAGANDVQVDARFSSPAAGAPAEGFRLRASSPAIDRGDSNLGSASLVQALTVRSATVTGAVDAIPLDIGYHFPR